MTDYTPELDAFTLYHLEQEEEAIDSIPDAGGALPALGHAVSGSIGAALSRVIIYPLELIITRLQAKRRKSSPDGDNGDTDDVEDGSIVAEAVKIYKDGGFSAFYVSLLPDTAKTVLDSFLFFLAYNFLQQSRQRAHVAQGVSSNPKRLSVAEQLLIGMGAGAFSRLFTTPLQTVVTRQQATKNSNSIAANMSTLQTAKQIRQDSGLSAFWAGYPYSLILTLNPSLTFILHNFLLRVTVPRSKRENPPARATFLIAAVAKALASLVTYPVALAKTRAQLGLSRDSKRADPKKEKSPELTTRYNQLLRVLSYPGLNVFAAIYEIIIEEGPSGLYKGVSGELLKSFLGHGLTMATKARIHSLVIQSYFFLLRIFRRLPVEKAGEKLKDDAVDVAKRVVDVGKTAVDKVKPGTEVLSDKIEELGDILEEVLRGKE
ncbi:mitochondrial carrier [Eremomyces bilateralis CBS 781.70]|uniref:Mitochondrial carrier n=1 Tax=Eremomyces bilateralis CBS 781.70 TaxID=1392243 RepID=A0A6G1FTY0_9PEZI|nr:mitochondrial carrier [Eremomyces bilateralis CBS 781.70]KAF1809345.1 mitochondrial carrier [Eremomyces bilateralis CBS 781.70]